MKYAYRISICMMVKDEEKNLRRCLESIKPLLKGKLAELIIIDTGSKDKTVEVAKEYTSKVYFHKWNNHFSNMRNISISYAKGEWIFIIDADERLDNIESFIKIMESKKPNKFNTIFLQVKNLNDANDEKQFVSNMSPRLFKNDGTFKYEGAVHNQPEFKGPFLNIDSSLTHFGYISNDRQLMEKKFNRTVTLIKSELEKTPENIYYRYQLGVSYDMHGDSEKAFDEFGRAYEILKSKSQEIRYSRSYVYGSYAKSTLINNKFIEAVDICKEGIKVRPDYIDLYYFAGEALMQLQNKDEAIKYYLKYIDLCNRYEELSISKDWAIALYNIDSRSKSNVYFRVAKYYIEKDDPIKAMEYCIGIETEVQKADVTVRALLMLKDYSKLRKYYEHITDPKIEDYFLANLEDQIDKLVNSEKIEAYREFSQCDSLYGLFNQIRVCSDDQKDILLNEFFKKANFNCIPTFYAGAFKSISKDKRSIFYLFRDIDTLKIRIIVKYLIDKYEEFTGIFEEYLMTENIRPNDVQGNKVYISVAAIMLIQRLENTNEVSSEYYNIFKLYIERGINFVSQVYNIQKARVIYKSVNNSEDRFFMLMYIVNDYINRGSVQNSIKYFREAVWIYEPMVKYIDVYKDEIYKCELTDK